jgi:hypothetical protein
MYQKFSITFKLYTKRVIILIDKLLCYTLTWSLESEKYFKLGTTDKLRNKKKDLK